MIIEPSKDLSLAVAAHREGPPRTSFEVRASSHRACPLDNVEEAGDVNVECVSLRRS